MENLGSDTFLFLEIGSQEPLVVRQEGKVQVPIGTRLSVSPNQDDIHRFDEAGRPIR